MIHFGTLVRRGRHVFCRTHDDVTGKYSWHTTGTGDMALAKMWRRAAEEAEYKDLLAPNVKSTTLGPATAAWLAELTPRIREITMRKLKQVTRDWLSCFGDVELRTLDAAQVEGYLAAGELANSTRNQNRSYLKWFFHGWAMRHGFVEADVTAQVPQFPVEEKKIRAFPDLALSALLPHLSPRLIHDYVVVALQTGLRQRTLLQLRWEHVDLARGWLKIPAALMKSNRDFEAPLTSTAIDTLKGLRDRVEGRVFNLASETLRRHWLAALKRAGLPEFKLHDLRRTFLTNARRRGVPMEVAMALSDHRDLRVVLRCYRAVDEEELLRAVGREVGGYGSEVSVVRSAGGGREGRPG